MACYKPLTAWLTDEGQVVFAERGRIHRQLTLPCRQCIGCKLESSRQWAVRCMHEAKMYHFNCFLTLTLEDQYLTDRYWTGLYYKNGNKAYAGTLDKTYPVKFLKRLRQATARQKTSPPAPRGARAGGGSQKQQLSHRLPLSLHQQRSRRATKSRGTPAASALLPRRRVRRTIPAPALPHLHLRHRLRRQNLPG